MIVIETERLLLRRLDRGDADFLLALMNEPAYLKNIGDRGVRTREDAERYIEDAVVASYESHGYGMYLVALRANGRAVGIAGLVNRPALPGVDVGFAIAGAHRRAGYASEAAAAVLRHAVVDLGLRRVSGVVAPDNAASIRVLEKLGLRYERRVRLVADEEPVLLYGRELGAASEGPDRSG
jgi:RimJ/RimL family protein N-acetyltransferase